jgi:hypothetical protein
MNLTQTDVDTSQNKLNKKKRKSSIRKSKMETNDKNCCEQKCEIF